MIFFSQKKTLFRTPINTCWKIMILMNPIWFETLDPVKKTSRSWAHVKTDAPLKNMCVCVTVYSHISWAGGVRCKMSRRRLRAQLQGGLGRGSVTLAGIHRDALCSLSNSGSHPAFKYFHLLIKPSKLQSWGNVCGQTLFQRKIVGSQLKMS